MSTSTCIRISSRSYKILKELKKKTGISIIKLIESLYDGVIVIKK